VPASLSVWPRAAAEPSCLRPWRNLCASAAAAGCPLSRLGFDAPHACTTPDPCAHLAPISTQYRCARLCSHVHTLCTCLCAHAAPFAPPHPHSPCSRLCLSFVHRAHPLCLCARLCAGGRDGQPPALAHLRLALGPQPHLPPSSRSSSCGRGRPTHPAVATHKSRWASLRVFWGGGGGLHC
jgi:hypothetical protein